MRNSITKSNAKVKPNAILPIHEEEIHNHLETDECNEEDPTEAVRKETSTNAYSLDTDRPLIEQNSPKN